MADRIRGGLFIPIFIALHSPVFMYWKLSKSARGKRTGDMSLVVNSVFAATSRGGWFGGAKVYHGNPYDDHTLMDRLQPFERIAAGQPECAFVDRGYRGGTTAVRYTSSFRQATARKNGFKSPAYAFLKIDGLFS